MKRKMQFLVYILLLCSFSLYGATSTADSDFLKWNDSYIKSNSTGDNTLDQKISDSVAEKVSKDLENDTFSMEKYQQYVSEAYDDAQKSSSSNSEAIEQAKSKATGGFICACASELSNAFSDFNAHIYTDNLIPLTKQIGLLREKIEANTKALKNQTPELEKQIVLLQQKVLEAKQMLYDLKERELQLRK